MKVYVSLPFSFQALSRGKERADTVKSMIEERGHQAVTPFDVCPEPKQTFSDYIGRYVKTILECDAILRCAGWSLSKRCSLESECAHIYFKKIFDHVKEIPKA